VEYNFLNKCTDIFKTANYTLLSQYSTSQAKLVRAPTLNRGVG